MPDKLRTFWSAEYEPQFLKGNQSGCLTVSDFRATSVPNANHYAQYTAPGFVNDKIMEFLSK